MSDRPSRLDQGGFTVLELLAYFVIAIVVVAAVYQLLMGQNRLYMKQRELQDVRSSLRAAGNLLAYEFRQASAVGGDIHTVTADSFSIRSLAATGVVCGLHANKARAGLWDVAGELTATEDDSALVFSASGTDSWQVGLIEKIWTPNDGGVPWCDWGSGSDVPPDAVVEISGGSRPPDLEEGEISIEPSGTVEQGATVTFTASHPDLSCSEFDGRVHLKIEADGWDYEGSMTGCEFTVPIPVNSEELEIEIEIEGDDYTQLSGDIKGKVKWTELDEEAKSLETIETGAPFRAFRRTQYGIYQDGGRWWLGRKVGSASSYEKLTGPLRAPADSGLVLVYYDASGNVTTDPTAVTMVDIILRGESLHEVPRAGAAPTAQHDTLTLRVSLRG